MAESAVVKEFMSCLREAEEHKDASRLARLFSEDAELKTMTKPNQGKAHVVGALAFWNQYLHAFDHVRSYVTNVIESDGTAILEWHATGKLAMGLPVDYCGVGFLEHKDGKIHAFRTYFDSAALLPHANHAMKPFSESVGVPDIRTDASS